MKNIFFVALAIVCSSATISAQSKAPKEVETAFYSKFPKATKVKWDKENATEYEASFTENNVKHSALDVRYIVLSIITAKKRKFVRNM